MDCRYSTMVRQRVAGLTRAREARAVRTKQNNRTPEQEKRSEQLLEQRRVVYGKDEQRGRVDEAKLGKMRHSVAEEAA